MELIKFLGWFLLNVGVPLLAPIALLPLLGAGRTHRGRIKTLIRWSVRDGQLYWPVIAMCAAACYEAAGLLGNIAADRNTHSAAIAWIAIVWHVLIIVAASVLVTVGTSDAMSEAPGKTENTLTPLVLISIAGSILTSISYSVTHLLAS